MAIPTRITSEIDLTTASMTIGGGINYIVETPTGVNYCFFMDLNQDPAFKKSLNGGMTWGTATVLKNITCKQISVWYQRWTDPTGTLGDKIWCCYTDSGSDDVYIRSVDTANSDALGTEYVVFAGASTDDNAALSICQMRGGNLICAGMIDSGAEPFCRRSIDSGANWTNLAAVQEAASDQIIMMPGWDADTQDGMAFYYDNSANEISVKYYDNSGDSWSEASIATSVTFPTSTNSLGHWSAAVDHVNSANILVFWTAIDTALADLKCYSCTQSAQTAKTNVITDSPDDQGFAALSISGSNWYVIYGGVSDGSDSYTRVRHYYKLSTDGGANWGAETLINFNVLTVYIFTKPIYYKSIGYYYFSNPTGVNYTHFYNAPLAIPRSTYQLGM